MLTTSAPTAVPTRVPAWRGTIFDAIAGASVGWLGLAFVAAMENPLLSPRRAWLIAVLPLGAWAFSGLVRRQDRAALVAGAWLTVALISSALAAAPWPALAGVLGRQPSVFLWLSSLGLWAIGRNLSPWGRTAVAWSFVAVACVNLGFALIQLVESPVNPWLSLDRGRPTGLAMSPVYLGALATGSAAWFARRSLGSVRIAWVGVFVASFLAVLSGARWAAAATLAVVFFARWGKGLRDIAGNLALALVGFVSASLAHAALGSDAGAVNRAVKGGGFSDRLEVWSYGVQAWLDQPVIGHGVGRFAAATRPYYTDDWVRQFPTSVWFDSHNIVVEQFVTVGIVGALLMAWFVYLHARHAHGPLAWMTAAITVSWLVEPASHVTLPIAAILAGAAMTVGLPSGQDLEEANVRSTVQRPIVAGLLGLGLVFGVWYSAADIRLDDAAEAQGTSSLDAFMVWFSGDPVAAEVIAVAHVNVFDRSAGDSELALAWTERAARLEPDDPYWWAQVATRRLRVGDTAGAAEAALRGATVQPNHPLVLRAQHAVALAQDDRPTADAAWERLCEVLPNECS